MESLGKLGDQRDQRGQRSQIELDLTTTAEKRNYLSYSKAEIEELGSEVVRRRENGIPLTPELEIFEAADRAYYQGDDSHNPRRE